MTAAKKAAKQSWLHKKLKLSHHRHTGKRLPAQHTSHGVLLVLAVAVGILVLYVTKSLSANAAALTGQGSLGLSGLVRVTNAAQLSQPINKQVFHVRQVNVLGACPVNPPNNSVEIVDNGIITGSAPCIDGTFQLKVDLFAVGVNFFRARVVDSAGRTGPDSVVIRLTYQPTGGSPSGNLLNISPEARLYTASAGKPFSLTLTPSGGQSPYAIDINWGDGERNIVSRTDGSSFIVTHTYTNGGQFDINIIASDSLGHEAHSQTVALVSGLPAAGSTIAGPQNPVASGPSIVSKLLPTYAVLTSAILAFSLAHSLLHVRFLKLPKLPHLRI